MPLISVIVPLYNAELHLEECLDSILRQTHRDLEIILVDDGSTDQSAEILAGYAARDPRITVVAGPAQGSAGAARNTGLEIATGTYLSFLDADDVFAPTMLEELHSRAVADDADVVLSKFRLFHDNTRDTSAAEWSLRLEHLPRKRPFSPNQVADHLFFSVTPAAWNKLFRASFVRSRQLRFQPLRHTNDAYFTLMSLAQAERITYLDRALVHYRVGNSASLQGTLDKSPLEFVEALEAIRAGLREAGLYSTFERAFVNQALMTCLANLKRQTTLAGFLAVYDALRKDILQRFEVADRPPEYFLRDDLHAKLWQILQLTPDSYLFHRLSETLDTVEQAEARARRALHQAGLRAALARDPQPAPLTILTASARDASTGPAVSVIVPVYNTELFLQECLDSVLRQSGVDLEVICVDDGSTDGSARILDGYAARDSRLRVIHQANTGLSDARNAGLAASTGRYLCFLDSDDYWRLDGLAELVLLADSSDLDVVMFDAASLREPGVDDALWLKYHDHYTRKPHLEPRSGVVMVADLGDEYRPSACLYLVKRELLEDGGLQFYPGIAHEDNLFTFTVMLRAGRVSHVSTAHYARRVRPGSIVTALDRAASARGYFITYVEMVRALASHDAMDQRAAAAMGDLAYRIFRGARNNTVGLSEELVERLGEVDPAADAQAVFLLLRQAWSEGRRVKLLSKRLKLATGGETLSGRRGWRRHRLVVAIKPYAKRLLGRG